MVFKIPTKAEAGTLSAEIAGEGQKVIHSDGEQLSWNPPPARPVMPDWSGIKSIARYFNRVGHQVWPAWLYHPTEEARLLRNADEAGELGVCYREATADERSRYGHKAVWDWADDSKWRPQPWSAPKFDPLNMGQGKTYVPSVPNPVIAQNALVEALIPQVAAAVAQALKSSGPSAPTHIDPKQWEEFLQFQAFRKTAEAIDVVKDENILMAQENALNVGGEDRATLEDEAKRRGIKTDGRWSMDRLKTELEKAA